MILSSFEVNPDNPIHVYKNVIILFYFIIFIVNDELRLQSGILLSVDTETLQIETPIYRL